MLKLLTTLALVASILAVADTVTDLVLAYANILAAVELEVGVASATL